MVVLKFGGTSVGTVSSILTVRDIIAEKSKKEQLIVVFSAIGGVTNKLERTIHLAIQGNKLYLDILKETEKIHISFLNELVKSNPSLLEEEILRYHKELHDLTTGIFLLREVHLNPEI